MRASVVACVWMVLWAWVDESRSLGTMNVQEVEWRRVQVESSRFTRSVMHRQPQLSSVTLRLCGMACTGHSKCHLWCLTNSKCRLMSLIVSGSYQPSLSSEAHTCYTNRMREIAFGANVTSSETVGSKDAGNLVDGIYDGSQRDITQVIEDNGTNAWLLVDLGVARTITEVMVMAQSSSTKDEVSLFSNFEVKAGDVWKAGDFTSYTLLGSFKGPGLFGQQVKLRPHSPLSARFISIQKTDSADLKIAHLEIY